MSGNFPNIATWGNFHQNETFGIIHHDVKSRNNQNIVESYLTFVALGNGPHNAMLGNFCHIATFRTICHIAALEIFYHIAALGIF